MSNRLYKVMRPVLLRNEGGVEGARRGQLGHYRRPQYKGPDMTSYFWGISLRGHKVCGVEVGETFALDAHDV